MKRNDTHTNKIKYCSSKTFDEHNNTPVKGYQPGYALINGTNIFAPPMLNIYLSDHTFTKYDIFEATVTFTPWITTIGIVSQYCGK